MNGEEMKEDEMNEEEDENKIRQALYKKQVKSAFRNYSKDMRCTYSNLYSNEKMNKYFSLVRERKRAKLEQALQANQKFLDLILESTFDVDQEKQFNQNTACHNLSKIRTTVKQFFREWCAQSPEIKDYSALVSKASKYLNKGDKILAPGSGLGRLVLELVEVGFSAQGNEVTYFMLFGSNFILNCTQKKEQFQIYPFIHSTSNQCCEDNIFRSVRIPDKVAIEVTPENADFSMAAGEFTQIYGNQENFDGIITCFFLDTANNIFKYVDTIAKTVKMNGIWINLGPLLFHYKDMLDEISIQISWEQLIAYIQSMGFIKEEEEPYETTYCHDPNSSYSHTYHCKLNVWRKVKNIEK